MSDFRIVPISQQPIETLRNWVPKLFLDAGESVWRRYIEFFTATIRNPNTRQAYYRATRQFARWCERKHLTLEQLDPFLISAYIEEKGKTHSKPTVKQHLAALRMLFDFLVIGHGLKLNPASAVRGPKHIVKRGKTPVLSPGDARLLLDSIAPSTWIGARDRALIAVMIYSFARVGAVVAMDVADYYLLRGAQWIRLHEKGGKRHDVPVHPEAQRLIEEYLSRACLAASDTGPLFRRSDRRGIVQLRRLHRREVLAMIKRRCKRLGLPETIGCHSFRATGITTYLENGGTLEKAQQMANHESPRTTKLYDRSSQEVSLDEVERIIL